jgi:hypothetical protein
VLDDDEAVFGVLEGGDEEAAHETEDEDVALHEGVVKKYNGPSEEVVSPARKQKGRGAKTRVRLGTSANRKLSRDRLEPTVSYERIFLENVPIESRARLNQYFLIPVVAISTFWNYEAGNLSKYRSFGRGGGDRICIPKS